MADVLPSGKLFKISKTVCIGIQYSLGDSSVLVLTSIAVYMKLTRVLSAKSPPDVFIFSAIIIIVNSNSSFLTKQTYQ
jgi:high-affinity nickel permease